MANHDRDRTDPNISFTRMRDGTRVPDDVNAICQINENDHVVIGVRVGMPFFSWFHYTATGPAQGELSIQPAVWEQNTHFDLSRTNGMVYGFALPHESLLRLDATVRRHIGGCGELRNRHDLAFSLSHPDYRRYNCATAAGNCLKTAGVGTYGSGEVGSGLLLNFLLQHRQIDNRDRLVFVHEIGPRQA